MVNAVPYPSLALEYHLLPLTNTVMNEQPTQSNGKWLIFSPGPWGVFMFSVSCCKLLTPSIKTICTARKSQHVVLRLVTMIFGNFIESTSQQDCSTQSHSLHFRTLLRKAQLISRVVLLSPDCAILFCTQEEIMGYVTLTHHTHSPSYKRKR